MYAIKQSEESGIPGEMAGFRIGTENIQDEAGTSYIAREQESD